MPAYHFTIITKTKFSAFGFINSKATLKEILEKSKSPIPNNLIASILEHLEIKLNNKLLSTGFTTSTSDGICICRFRSDSGLETPGKERDKALELLEDDVETIKSLELNSRANFHANDPVTDMLLGALNSGFIKQERALGIRSERVITQGPPGIIGKKIPQIDLREHIFQEGIIEGLFKQSPKVQKLKSSIKNLGEIKK